ncbi:MAG: DUF1211 domain-containing protein [Chloroflexi bacterium]|nr:DUF1211 domain-containing protein [Chloroflexota bacterium]MBU1752230.1 DUF1211 domain-containing protein [Chloroflexota bacterium]MBU1879378.1 DUF1211 domain-containing protein [Chloroflexota bacterium]
MSTPEKETHEGLGLDRIVFFSDAVIAIAITLLVLEVKVPEIEPNLVSAELTQQVLALWPRYMGFLVSFWVIALYWSSHHRIFGFIKGYDRPLMFLNLLFLMCIAFVPFTTDLVFTYPGQFIAVVFYAGTVAGMGLAILGVWLYAARKRRLVDADLPRSTVSAIRNNLLAGPTVFLLSIGLAFVNPTWAMISWILTLPVYLMFRLAGADG